MTWRRIPRGLRWGGGIALLFVALLVGVCSIADWNFARHRIAALASAKLHRDVNLNGNLSAHLLSSHPTIRIEGLTIGNPDWASDEMARDMVAKNMAEVERLVVALNLGELFRGHLMLETLEVDNPKVAIIGDKEGRYNFEFDSTDKNSKYKNSRPPKWPGVRQFSVRGGEVYVSDAIHKLTFKGSVAANENAERPEQVPFRMHGEGTLNGEPFRLIFQGGPLANIKMDRPYEFDADVTAGKTHVMARGQFERPFDVARIATQLDVQGDNLAHLYYLTNLALPFTPPYKASGQLKTSTSDVVVTNLKGVVGKSDMSGDVNIHLKGARPRLTAKLRSHSLNLADLSPAFGKGVTVDSSSGKTRDSEAPRDMPGNRLLPTYEFEFDRLQKMDADVTLHADSIQAQQIPFTGVDINVALNDSVLELNPVVFSLPLGKIDAKAHLDAKEKPAAETVDLRLTNVKLDQFKGKKSPAPLDGTLQARAELTGNGNSVHDFAAHSNGKITVVVPHGEIRQAFAELTGINVAHGLGLLLTKNQQRSNIRCGVAAFDVQHGNAAVQELVFDTDTMVIKGSGKVNLQSEALDLNIKGEPKKARAVRLRTPITLNGTLRKPSIGVNAGETAKQVGIAAAIGSLVAPLAAALAFIDPGLAKDQNCAALLADAQKALPPSQRTSQTEPASAEVPAEISASTKKKS